jgi:hypothetical protein
MANYKRLGFKIKRRSTKCHMSSHGWMKEDSIIFSFLPKTHTHKDGTRTMNGGSKQHFFQWGGPD